jgi:hypothetical protein
VTVSNEELMAVSLNMVLTYPPTYPDVAPEITFETVEDDDDDEEGEGGNGELTEEEEETVLAQLNTIVRQLPYTRRRNRWAILAVMREE